MNFSFLEIRIHMCYTGLVANSCCCTDMFALLQIVQPDAIKPTGNSFETYTSNFKKCDGSIGEDLKFENECVRSAFAKRLTDDYASVVKEF